MISGGLQASGCLLWCEPESVSYPGEFPTEAMIRVRHQTTKARLDTLPTVTLLVSAFWNSGVLEHRRKTELPVGSRRFGGYGRCFGAL